MVRLINLVRITIVLLFIYLAVTLLIPIRIETCINIEYYKNESILGIVENKEENNWNHQSEIAYFTNGSKFVWSDDVWAVPGFYNKIAIGDSIRKPKGSCLVEIHKQDTIIYFDMLKNCKGYEENRNKKNHSTDK